MYSAALSEVSYKIMKHQAFHHNAHTLTTPASIFQRHGERRPVRTNHTGGGRRLMKLDWQWLITQLLCLSWRPPRAARDTAHISLTDRQWMGVNWASQILNARIKPQDLTTQTTIRPKDELWIITAWQNWTRQQQHK